MKQIYLATPFSQYPDPDARIEQILDKMADITKSSGVYVVSAIMYYPLLIPKLPSFKNPPFDWWYETSKQLVRRSDELWVWNTDNVPSTGTDVEIEEANKHGLPIFYIS